MSDKECIAITTTDNPYDPIDQFDEWYQYDESHGYHTCSYLARIADTSPFLGDRINDKLVADAIDEIIRINGDTLYKKVVR